MLRLGYEYNQRTCQYLLAAPRRRKSTKLSWRGVFSHHLVNNLLQFHIFLIAPLQLTLQTCSGPFLLEDIRLEGFYFSINITIRARVLRELPFSIL
jgi:hypothetical protein